MSLCSSTRPSACAMSPEARRVTRRCCPASGWRRRTGSGSRSALARTSLCWSAPRTALLACSLICGGTCFRSVRRSDMDGYLWGGFDHVLAKDGCAANAPVSQDGCAARAVPGTYLSAAHVTALCFVMATRHSLPSVALLPGRRACGNSARGPAAPRPASGARAPDPLSSLLRARRVHCTLNAPLASFSAVPALP